MDAAALFAAYRRERRDQLLPGFARENLPHLTRYTAADKDGFVAFAELPSDRARAVIREQIAHFEARGMGFEWKVYAFDRPADLCERLAAEGFRADAEEVFLVLPLDPPSPRPHAAGVRIEKIESEPRLADVIAVQESVWGRRTAWMTAALAQSIGERRDDVAVFCAYLGDRAVGTGWVDLVPGSSFADLHGGCVLPDARGRGLYTRLLEARASIARARGYGWLAVDAAPMSRPILERKGFAPVCPTWPMKRPAPGSAVVPPRAAQ